MEHDVDMDEDGLVVYNIYTKYRQLSTLYSLFVIETKNYIHSDCKIKYPLRSDQVLY
jgi:hypothetical protein